MATKSNLVIDQGSTFSTDLTMNDDAGSPIDLGGYTANSQIRRWYTSSNASATFTTSININTAVITLSLTANQTGALTAGRYVYDVELSDGAIISRIVEGVVTITPQVTR